MGTGLLLGDGMFWTWRGQLYNLVKPLKTLDCAAGELCGK